MLSGFCPARLSAVLQCDALQPIHTLPLDHVVSGASFLTKGVFECDLAHRRSVAGLCMLYKIRCNQMPLLYGAVPEPYVLVRATRGAVIAHRYTYAPPSCTA